MILLKAHCRWGLPLSAEQFDDPAKHVCLFKCFVKWCLDPKWAGTDRFVLHWLYRQSSPFQFHVPCLIHNDMGSCSWTKIHWAKPVDNSWLATVRRYRVALSWAHGFVMGVVWLVWKAAMLYNPAVQYGVCQAAGISLVQLLWTWNVLVSALSSESYLLLFHTAMIISYQWVVNVQFSRSPLQCYYYCNWPTSWASPLV